MKNTNVINTRTPQPTSSGKGLLKKASDIIRKTGRKLFLSISAIYASVWLILSTGINSLAAGDTSAVTKPLDNLKTLVLAVIGAIGIIILAKNVMEFAQAYQAQDSATMNSALKGIVAGIIMAGIATVLTFLGF